MRRPFWKSIFSCLDTPPQSTCHDRAVHAPGNAQCVKFVASHIEGSDTRILALLPIVWAYLSRSERLALRACCWASRRVHDSLVTDLCVCDDSTVLSGVPADRLPRSPLPICQASAHKITTALRGLAERGCQPHLLLVCLSEGHEQRRHEKGIAALSALANAACELSVIHLCGVPLTPQTARALINLLASAPASGSPMQIDIPVPKPLGTASVPAVRGPSAAPSLSSICSMPPPRTLTAAMAPPTVPLHLNLYGYDLVRQPAAAAVEMLFSAVGPRLTKLEIWGCVGWPSRLSALLHTCLHVRHFAVSLQQLLATGAVVAFTPIAAATTAACVVKTVGGMQHLRSLELRGFIVNMARRTSCDSVGRCSPPRPSAASKAAAERAAIAAAAPSVQQLAAALYQLTSLTRLSIDGLSSATPLLTAVAAMRSLRQLEFPDAAAPAASDLAAIARAAPRLVALTLGSVGPGTVLDSGATVYTAAPTAAPEELPLPPTLATLRVARCRPTLRTMRSLVRTVEGRLEAAPAAPTGTDPSDGADRSSPTRIAVVVPGIDIDMLDIEFDALQGFSRGSDGILRSTMLPESAEALAAAIRLLVPPLRPLTAPPSPLLARGLASNSRNSLSGFGAVASPSAAAACGGGGAGCISTSSYGLGASSSFGGFFASSLATQGGGRYGGGGGGGTGLDEAECGPAFGQAVTRELTIHNSHGSLCPPSQEQLAPAGPLVPLPVGGLEATPPAASELGTVAAAAGGQADDRTQIDSNWITGPPLVCHAVWISEMKPLGLASLELYGIGILAGDLEAVAELTTLQRLTLASGELEVDALPCLAALPLLEYLEMARCTPCRHRRGGGGGGYVRPSTSSGFVRGSGGDAFARASGVARQSCASVYDNDGDVREVRPSGKRALLELCLTAPRLRKVFIVRCMGIVCGSGGTEGPLGAEWVRQRLLAAGPRVRDGQPSSAPAAAPGAEVDFGWPEIKWD